MTKEELAAKLTGREYTNEITKTEEAEAKKSGLVVIFGASDDLAELRGAIYDEAGCYDGGEFFLDPTGKQFLLPQIEDEDDEILKKYGVSEAARAVLAAAIKVEALWCKEPGYSWTFATDAPHATFEVMEDGEHYCRGIVIDLKECVGSNHTADKKCGL